MIPVSVVISLSQVNSSAFLSSPSPLLSSLLASSSALLCLANLYLLWWLTFGCLDNPIITEHKSTIQSNNRLDFIL